MSNDGANSVTELNARTAKLVRVVPGLSAAAACGTDLFVSDGPVVEINARTGERVWAGRPAGGLGGFPTALALHGGDLFYATSSAQPAGGSISEFDASTGQKIRVISGADLPFRLARCHGHRRGQPVRGQFD